jgi:F0F1-type ATP synthase membrane subunit b/b'
LSKKDDEVKAELNKAKADLQKETDTKVGNCRRDLEKIIADNKNEVTNKITNLEKTVKEQCIKDLQA